MRSLVGHKTAYLICFRVIYPLLVVSSNSNKVTHNSSGIFGILRPFHCNNVRFRDRCGEHRHLHGISKPGDLKKRRILLLLFFNNNNNGDEERDFYFIAFFGYCRGEIFTLNLFLLYHF